MLRRLVAVLLLSAALSVATAAVAAAHAKLESVTPGDGSAQLVAPARVVLTFNEPVGSTGTDVHVRSPSGKDVSTGAMQVIDNTVTQPVGGLVEVGRYAVDARVRSADGHPVTVSATFTLTRPGPPAATTSAVAAAAAGSPAAVVIAVALLALSVSSLTVAVRRRAAAT